MSPALARQRAGAKRAAVTRFSTIPAPIGGLNARDSVAEMQPTDAITLDNFVPGTTDCTLRAGYRSWATGMGSTTSVETLLPYRSGTTNKLFAVAGGKIYDASVQGPVGAAAISGLTNSRFQYVNFGTAGGQFLLAVNGADAMRRYDGSAWTDATAAPAVTGFNTTLAISINAYGQRIWLTEKNSFRVWYLPLQSIGGAATSLDLSSLFRLGGSLAGMITWTVAAPQQTVQYAVFVSTEGEVAIYEGYDPASASTWALVGTARIGRPIGGRFWTRLGTDVVLICTDGFVPLSKVLQLDRSSEATAISNKIDNAARLAIAGNTNNFGWQAMLYPSGNKLFVNVPTQENATSYQFVLNTITGAWCRYVGINSNVWETVQDSIYFGGVDGSVYQAEYGNDDDGASIFGVLRPAFTYFGDRTIRKKFNQVRPTVIGGGIANVLIDLTTDFDTSDAALSPALSSVTSLPTWDVSPWDTTAWQPGRQVTSQWTGVSGTGFAASARIQINCKGFAPSIEAIAYAFEAGGLY
jgi:hypothetical protein